MFEILPKCGEKANKVTTTRRMHIRTEQTKHAEFPMYKCSQFSFFNRKFGAFVLFNSNVDVPLKPLFTGEFGRNIIFAKHFTHLWWAICIVIIIFSLRQIYLKMFE